MDFFTKRKEYHNLFTDLQPPWQSEMIGMKRIVEDLNQLGLENLYVGIREYKSVFLFLYINWQVFKDRLEIIKYSYLPDPYDVLFRMYLRGAVIDRYDSQFIINDVTYLKYDNKFSLPSIEDDFLNYIDEICTDIPNQSRVNQLWTDFQRSKFWNE